MYKELITDVAGDNRYVRIQLPATAMQIKRAEEAIRCQFPEELTALLGELDGDKWLIFSTDEIIETTQRIREAMAEDYPGIERHLFFAGNGCGDYYAYGILPGGYADASVIYRWDHETNETCDVAANMTDLIRRYYQDEI